MELRALTWNLFHGRDYPPDPALLTLALAAAADDERNATHVQVNRDLLDEFAAAARRRRLGRRPAAGVPAALVGAARRMRRGAERPPRAHLAQLAGAAARAGRPPQPRPDRLQRGRLEPDPGPGRDRRAPRARARARARGPSGARWPSPAPAPVEPRDRGLRRQPPRQRRPAPCALTPSARSSTPPSAPASGPATTPLVFGGDLNLRPRETDVFDHLAERFGLRRPTAPGSLDHLLVGGLEIAVAAGALAARAPRGPRRREARSGSPTMRRCRRPSSPRDPIASAHDART